MKIVVVGSGYVGISNAVLLSVQNEVVAVDISETRVNMLNHHISPLVDPCIEDYLSRSSINLRATLDGCREYADADYVIISTPTNYDVELNHFDTSSVEGVIQDVLQTQSKALIVIKSTIPIGFTRDMCQKFSTGRIVFSPEFLREGQALYDNLYPSRIIVGVAVDDRQISRKAMHFLQLLKAAALKENVQTLFMGSTEAESVKLFSNAYLAMRVAYFNELDTYAAIHDLNTKEIIEGVSLDPRVGNHYNNPSFGYGGYCLPKDTKQLCYNFRNTPSRMMEAIVQSNVTRMDFIAQQVLEAAGYPKTQGIIIGIHRLVMKSQSDNFRESAIQGIMRRIHAKNVQMLLYEPSIKEDVYAGIKVEHDLKTFKEMSCVIITNRKADDLSDVKMKVYTRDIWSNN